MEGSNLKGLVDEEIVMKMGKAAGIDLAFGGVHGALNSMMHDGPQYGNNVKYPQLIRTTKRLVSWVLCACQWRLSLSCASWRSLPTPSLLLFVRVVDLSHLAYTIATRPYSTQDGFS